MANVLLGNKNNIYSWAFNASAKTLTISNVVNFPLDVSCLIRIWNTTTSLALNLVGVTMATTYVAGLPVYTYTFATVPAGSANGDTLIIIVDIPQEHLNNSTLQYIAGATI